MTDFNGEILKLSKRIDVGIRFLLKIIFFNNRLFYYDFYIKLAKNNGYIVTSFIDYLENYQHKSKKVLILRHDIDINQKYVKSMFNIEKNNNVHATYYFRWSTFDKEIIKQINDANFEVGLHYETLGRYCEKNNINEVSNRMLDECRQKLKEEILKFKSETNINIKTISSHGLAKNKEINVTNDKLLEGENYKDYEIICEAYDKSFYTNVDTHIMDNNILNNYGFSYNTNPIESILKNDKLIVFLTHPVHWKYSLLKRLVMLIKILMGKYTKKTERQFRKITKEYYGKQ